MKRFFWDFLSSVHQHILVFVFTIDFFKMQCTSTWACQVILQSSSPLSLLANPLRGHSQSRWVLVFAFVFVFQFVFVFVSVKLYVWLNKAKRETLLEHKSDQLYIINKCLWKESLLYFILALYRPAFLKDRILLPEGLNNWSKALPSECTVTTCIAAEKMASKLNLTFFVVVVKLDLWFCTFRSPR